MTSPAGRTVRPGLSRAEAVIVLFIVVILGALIVTAVGKMRQAAARSQCESNLRQIALSVHSYHANYGCLPPLVDLGDGSPTGRGLPSAFATVWSVYVAHPFLYRPGARPPEAYHAPSSIPFNFRHKDGTTGIQEGGDANQVWRTFLCPADRTADKLRDVPATLPDGSTGHYATGSYAANGLLPWMTADQLLGSADTILFAERPQVCRTATGEVVHNLWGVGFYSPQMPAFAALAPADSPWSTELVAPVLPLPADSGAPCPVRVGSWGATPQPPDFPTPFQRIVPDRPCDPRLPGSPHSGGMQVAMADGSVRVFRSGTSPWTFWAACAPAPVKPRGYGE